MIYVKEPKIELLESTDKPEIAVYRAARVSHSSLDLDGISKEVSHKEIEGLRTFISYFGHAKHHESILEFADFLFAVQDVSRYAVEWLHHFRLISTMERSQRYVAFHRTKKGDKIIEFNGDKKSVEEFVYIPKTIKMHSHLYEEVIDFFRQCFELYKEMLDYNKNLKSHSKGIRKEDARYILPLATRTQLLYKANARELENIIEKSWFHPLAEIQHIAGQMYGLLYEKAPSLFSPLKTTEISYKDSSDVIEGLEDKSRKYWLYKITDYNKMVKDYPKEINKNVEFYNLEAITKLLEREMITISNFEGKSKKLKKRLMDKLEHELKNFYNDNKVIQELPRNFEFYVTRIFVPLISASAFAQLKRHRMLTILPYPYKPDKVIVPKSIEKSPFEYSYYNLMEKSLELWRRIYYRLFGYLVNYLSEEVQNAQNLTQHKSYSSNDSALSDNRFINGIAASGVNSEDVYNIARIFAIENANYIITNAHMRPVEIGANLRALAHFFRLRLDKHAQWDIRNTAQIILKKLGLENICVYG